MNEDLKIIRQEQTSGCMLACLATILGLDYWDVANDFAHDADKTPTKFEETVAYLSGLNFDTVLIEPRSWANVRKISLRVLKPFADIHIVSIKQFVNAKTNHAIVMTKGGKLFNPSDRQEFSLLNMYQVSYVLGIWYPIGWRMKKIKKRGKNDNDGNNFTNNCLSSSANQSST